MDKEKRFYLNSNFFVSSQQQNDNSADVRDKMVRIKISLSKNFANTTQL